MTDNTVSQCDTVNNHIQPPEPSYIENKLADSLDKFSVPYERQYELDGKYADFGIPGAQIVVECDGYAYHHSKEDRERDTSRDVSFALLGWHVLRFTGSQINKDSLGCALKVKEVFNQRATLLNLAVSKELCGEYAFPNRL